MHNHDPADRQALIDALRARSIDAYEVHGDGHTHHVVADLLDDGEANRLHIATRGADALCAVGLRGTRNGTHWEGPDWATVHSLAEAIDRFEYLWAARDRLTTWFRVGEP